MRLESFTRCPKCGRNDRVEKVTAILSRSPDKSHLTEILSPPPKLKPKPKPLKQDKPKKTRRTVIDPKSVTGLEKGGNILKIFSILLLLPFVFCLFVSIVLLSRGTLDGFVVFLVAALFPLLAAVALMIIRTIKIRKDKETIKAMQESADQAWQRDNEEIIQKWENNYQNRLRLWQQENCRLEQEWKAKYAIWEKLYYCHRDDCVYFPGKRTCVPVENINTLISTEIEQNQNIENNAGQDVATVTHRPPQPESIEDIESTPDVGEVDSNMAIPDIVTEFNEKYQETILGEGVIPPTIIPLEKGDDPDYFLDLKKEKESSVIESDELVLSEQGHESEDCIEDVEKNHKPHQTVLDIDDRFDDRQDEDRKPEITKHIQDLSDSTELEWDTQISDDVEPIALVRPEQKQGSTSKSRVDEPWSPGSYYGEFIYQRNFFKDLSDDEIDAFFAKLAREDIKDITEWSLIDIENYLNESLKRVHLIGELPISLAAFNQLCQYNQDIRVRSTDERLSRQKTIPPAFFVTMMVFCARYSKEDARNFWRPYGQLVWGSVEANLSFQNVCRDHFRACREDLANTVGLNFHIYREGDVVLPVYQHAIIPYHLMAHMANWIVQNFEIFLKFNPQQLQYLISDKETLRYLPHHLQRFLTDENTSQTAATLLDKMADAISIFKEKGSETMVESIIESPIEKSLWHAIYNQLIVDSARLEKITKVIPKLEWVWLMEEEELGLCLSGVQSPPDQKPNTLYFISDRSFKTATFQKTLNPFLGEEKGWDLEKIILSVDKLIGNEELFVVSDKFDLDKSTEEQPACVLYEEKIPTIEEDWIFFRQGLNQKKAKKKDTINSDGNWIILSKSDFDIQQMNGESIPHSACFLSRFLRNSGFKHIRKYALTLPIRMVRDEMETQIEVLDGPRYLEPIISGDHPIAGLSAAVPPAFQSQAVFLTFDIDAEHPLRRTYFSISKKKTEFTTQSLSDLKRSGQLSETEHGIRIDLGKFLVRFGRYQVDIFYGLRSLFDEPIVFSYLPNMKISPPEMDMTYFPGRPFQIKISGVAEEMLDYPEDVKAILDGEPKLLRWKLHKASECSFSLNDGHGGHVELQWDIDRVAAWVDGGFNKNLIEVGQESRVKLYVRGKPYQEFQWIINDETISPGKLDSRGEFSNILRDTQIRDLLRETNTSLSKVEIEIEDMRWQVFQYMKKPRVGILEISYKHKVLKYKLSLSRILRGKYQLQVKKKGALAAPVAVCDTESLEIDNTWDVELSTGDFLLEIYLDNELLVTSPTFSHRRWIPPAQVQMEDPLEVTKELTANTLFSILSADQLELQEYQKIIGVTNPFLAQLLCINDQSTWYVDGKIESGIRQLLPFWAVTKHPFRFTERNFHKKLTIFPEETALGGKVGKGYAYLKVDNKPVIVYAAWKPDVEEEYVKLLLSFPDNQIDPRLLNPKAVSNWDIDYTRPVYQCVDCGDLLGSGAGGFPPNIFNQHLHGKQRKADDQFIDTRHKESLDNTLSILNNETLDYRGSVEKSIIHNCAELFEKHSSIKKFGELSKPIVTVNNLDYGKAFTELFDNNKNDDKKDSIKIFLNQNTFFDHLDPHLNSLSSEIVAISAMKRLSDSISDDDSFCEIPKFTLNLCMLLRLKAHYEHVYSSYMDEQQISEDQLLAMVNAAMTSFPKLLEWSIAWAEIFFVHSIS